MVKRNHSQTKTYIVQDILDTKLNNGCQFYKVKWKGYSLAECTWEPEESFNCSRHILNQFLLARASKEPHFKEKLAKIEKEKEALDKNGSKGLDKTKGIKKSEKREKYQSGSDGSEENESEEKQERDDDNSEQSEEKGPQKTQNRKFPRNNQVKIQENNQVTSKSPSNPTHLTKQESSRFKLTSNNSESSQVKAKSPTISQQAMVKRQNGQQSTDPIEILLIKKEKDDGGLKFCIREGGKKVWKSREEMHQKFSRELCQYYEKHLSFDE